MAERRMRRTVLLVDDEPGIRAYARAVLQRQRYRVLEAADGFDALILLRELGGAVDVLVTDVDMPRMTGIELGQAVRTDFPGIPVVYISGDHVKAEFHDHPVRSVFLRKPFLPQDLLDSVGGVSK